MMSTTSIILAALGATMALALNWRALQSHGLPGGKMVRMALIWGVILVGLTLLLSLFMA